VVTKVENKEVHPLVIIVWRLDTFPDSVLNLSHGADTDATLSMIHKTVQSLYLNGKKRRDDVT
jgi:hypothetical protein